MQECPIQKIESQTEMRLEWDNRKVRHDGFLFWFFVLFWLVWAPVTLFATSMIFSSDAKVFFCIWCIFGWAGTLGIPYVLLQRYWLEWLVISKESLTCGYQGPMAPKPKHIPIAAIFEIGIGHYDTSDRESVVTLNVNYLKPKKRKTRQMLGYWLHPILKEKLFCDIQDFAYKHQIPLTFQRY